MVAKPRRYRWSRQVAKRVEAGHNKDPVENIEKCGGEEAVESQRHGERERRAHTQ